MILGALNAGYVFWSTFLSERSSSYSLSWRVALSEIMEGEKNNWMVAAFVVTAFLNFATGYLRLRHLAPGDYLAMLSIGMLVVAGTASVVTTFRLRERLGRRRACQCARLMEEGLHKVPEAASRYPEAADDEKA